MTRVAVNIGPHVLVWMCFNFLHCVHRSRIAGSGSNGCLIVLRLFSNGLHHFASPPTMCEGSFLHILTNTCYYLSFFVVICRLASLVGVMWDRIESEVTLKMEAREPGFLGEQVSCSRAGSFLGRDRNKPLCCGSTQLPETVCKGVGLPIKLILHLRTLKIEFHVIFTSLKALLLFLVSGLLLLAPQLLFNGLLPL